MIIAVTKEYEKAWAELCVELWPDLTVDSALRMSYEGLFKHEFLYFENDEPIAFISLSVRNDYVEGTDSSPVGYIEGLYVKPEFRRKGIAEKLVEHAKEWSGKCGCIELASDCTLDNTVSQAFHKSIGFTEVNKIVCFVTKI